MSERAIPHLRAMAIVRWILLGAVALIALVTWGLSFRGEDADHRPDRYYCPMHPQIRSPDPGTCPICHMTLEPIARRSERDAGIPDAAEEPEALASVMLTTERRQRAGITTVPARRITMEGSVRWPASIEASEGARGEVRVRANAFVERISVRQSNVQVRTGQALAMVYSPDIVRAEEELLVAHRWGGTGQAPPDVAAAESAARERLVLLGMSPSDIDAMLASGRSRRTIAVRAPISGYVTRFEAVVGSYVTPEVMLYEITDLSRVRIVATPFADDVAWLTPQASVRFSPRGSDATIPLALDLVEPAVTQTTRAIRVRFRATDSQRLRPGDIGEVLVDRPPEEALVVPRDAVIDTGRSRYVFVERSQGRFEPRRVELGALYEEQRIIVRGLSVGERVVARGAFVLDSESRLQAALAPHTEHAP